MSAVDVYSLRVPQTVGRVWAFFATSTDCSSHLKIPREKPNVKLPVGTCTNNFWWVSLQVRCHY